MSLASTAINELGNTSHKYCSALGYSDSTAWCAIFARWCGIQNNMNFGSSAVASELRGINGNFVLNTGVAPSSNIPKVGDLAFVNPNSDTKQGSVGHVGIITNISGGKITTVNGNWGGKVGYAYYHLNGTSYGTGYGSILIYGSN
ncbi:CHAP domain-containing protein [Paenibacillus tengchongensis]|uniref:CHAP domain-containing protein n=1 Tax=Paenibacillus tengchongensis TaxID=2608684 RepID=UPI001652A936|nr:CHAP domain-containing protein [Paenibacillus tengchongensis]